MEKISLFDIAHENTIKSQEQVIIQKNNMEQQMNASMQQAWDNAYLEAMAAQMEGRADSELTSLALYRKKNPDAILGKKFNMIDVIEGASFEDEIQINFETIDEIVETPEDVATKAKEHAKETAKKNKEQKPSKPRVRRTPICIQTIKFDGDCEMKISVARPTAKDMRAFEKQKQEMSR